MSTEISFEEKLKTLRDLQKERTRSNLPFDTDSEQREARIKVGEGFFEEKGVKSALGDLFYPVMRDYTTTHDGKVGSYYDEVDGKVILSTTFSWDVHLRDHPFRALKSFYFRQITISCGLEGNITIIAGNTPLITEEELNINKDGWQEAVQDKIYSILQYPDSTLIFFEDETYVLRASEKIRAR